MAQLYCYLAELIKKDVSEHNAWPEGYFELFGQWQGEPLVRTDSLLLEDRIASS
jgi:hypothetical protein